MSRRKISRSLIAGLFTGLGSIGAFAFGLAVVAPGLYATGAIQGDSQETSAGTAQTASDLGSPSSSSVPDAPSDDLSRSDLTDHTGAPEPGGNPENGLAQGPEGDALPGNEAVESRQNASLQNAEDPGNDVGENGQSATFSGGFGGFGFSRQGLAQGFAANGENEAHASLDAGLDDLNGDTSSGPANNSDGPVEPPALVETSGGLPSSDIPEEGGDRPLSTLAPDTSPSSILPTAIPAPPVPERSEPEGTLPASETGGGMNPEESHQASPSGPSTDGPETQAGPALLSPVREVPEPGSLGLLGLGLLGIGKLRQTRMRSAG